MPELTFLNPVAFLLLLILPGVYLLSRRSLDSLGPIRKWLALAIRLVILLCLILALAETQILRASKQLAVYFVLDSSLSIPRSARGEAIETINAMTERDIGSDDRAGLIVFGRTSQIEASPSQKLKVRQIDSLIERNYTDVASAVRLASAAFPEGTSRRIVLLTDGNENQGFGVEEVRQAHASGTQVHVLPIEYAHGKDVRVDKVVLPARVHQGEPFEIRAVIEASQATEAEIRFLENDRPIGPAVGIELDEGKNTTPPVKATIDRSGFYTYKVVVTTDGDEVPQNNQAEGFAYVEGRPHILYLTGEDRNRLPLVDRLTDEGIRVIHKPVTQFGFRPRELIDVSALILDDVGAEFIPELEQLRVEAAVRDFGTGLVMIGGPNSFGAGGYQDSPIERALPVEMEIKHRKVMPSGALVLILHTCEMPNPNRWAKEISKAAIRVLSSRDKVGLLIWNGSDRWLFPLQKAKNKKKLYKLINNANPGDMLAFTGTMKLAHKALVASGSALKHVIIISDGDPSPPPPGLLQNYVKNKITCSTMGIAPHSPNDVKSLQRIAAVTKGRFYYVKNPRLLPQLFVKEAKVIRKSLILEEPEGLKPQVVNVLPELIKGFETATLPDLYGQVATTEKELADVPIRAKNGFPILANWQFGLGRSVAFTSDAYLSNDGRARWSRDWFAWSGYGKFWSQVVRWVSRTGGSSDFHAEITVRGARGTIVLDAVDAAGRYVNGLDVEGRVTTPSAKGLKVKLSQVGPGRYEASFPTEEVGTYYATITYERRGGRKLIHAGASVPYSPEYRTQRPNRAKLEKLATAGGGEVISPETNVFSRDNLKELPTPVDLWPILLSVALGLFPLDVFVRRVMFDPLALARKVAAPFAALLGRKSKKKDEERTEAMSRLMAAKKKSREREEEESTAKFEATGVDTSILESEAAPQKPSPGRPEPSGSEPAPPKADKADEEGDEDSYTSRLLRAKRRAMEEREEKEE